MHAAPYIRAVCWFSATGFATARLPFHQPDTTATLLLWFVWTFTACRGCWFTFRSVAVHLPLPLLLLTVFAWTRDTVRTIYMPVTTEHFHFRGWTPTPGHLLPLFLPTFPLCMPTPSATALFFCCSFLSHFLTHHLCACPTTHLCTGHCHSPFLPLPLHIPHHAHISSLHFLTIPVCCLLPFAYHYFHCHAYSITIHHATHIPHHLC